MYAEERRRKIASLTAVEGRVTVADLAEAFDVTAETIRRDLAQLDAEGAVHRVHGGAVATRSFQTVEFSVAARKNAQKDAKLSIARCAADFLPDSGGGWSTPLITAVGRLSQTLFPTPSHSQDRTALSFNSLAAKSASLLRRLLAIQHSVLLRLCVPMSLSLVLMP